MARPRVQFCPQGHDTFQIGRVPDGQCRQCAAQRVTVWRRAHPEYRRRDNARRMADKKFLREQVDQ